MLDVLLRAIRKSTLIDSDGDIDAIRAVNPTLSEAQRDTLVASFSYGLTTFGPASVLSSPTDCTILVDSDNSNPTTPYTNVLRIAKGQTTLPIIDPYRELLTIGSQSSPNGPTVMTIGPSASLFTAAEECSAALIIGSGGPTSTSPGLYGMLSGTNAGLLCYSPTAVGLNAGTSIFITAGKKISLSYTTAGVVDNAILLRETSYPDSQALGIFQPAADHFYFRSMKDTVSIAGSASIFFSGSYPHPATDPRMKVAIGGVMSVQNYDPDDLLIGGVYGGGGFGHPLIHHEGTFLVVSPDYGAVRQCGMRVWVKADSVPNDTHLINFHSNIDSQTAANNIRLFSVTSFWGANQSIAFEVRADRTICGGAWTTVGVDLAEHFETVAKEEPGTVMVFHETTKKVVPSTTIGSTAVIGVVSTKPGVLLGEYAFADPVLPLAMSGTVPVKVTTANGPLVAGKTLLVSAPDGRACAAPANPEPGTVIGKALESLDQSGDEPVTATIRMLVFMR